MIPISVYVDMDGVLVNFVRGIGKVFSQLNIKHDPTQHFPGKLWKQIIPAAPNLFRELQPMPDCFDLWRPLAELDKQNKIRLSILTAVPDADGGWPQSRVHKRQWVAEHLGTKYPVFVVLREEKKNFATDTYGLPSILIDDLGRNTEEWRASGGIPIHHKSAKSSVSQLKQILRTKFDR